MRNKAITGILSLILVGTIIILPGYLADKLQGIETAGDYYVSREEVVSSGSSEIQILPYLDFNEENAVWVYYPDKTPDDTGQIFFKENNDFHNNTGEISFDYSDNWDLTTSPIQGSQTVTLYLNFWIHAQTLLENGVTTLNIKFNSDQQYKISQLLAINLKNDNSCEAGSTSYTTKIPAEYQSQGSHGSVDFNVTFSGTDLNSLATYQTGYDSDHVLLQMWVWFYYIVVGDTIEWSMTWEPEFYEVEVTEDPTTNTTYTPASLTFSNFAVQKWSLGIGGGIIILTALATSPLWNPTQNYFLSRYKKTRSQRPRTTKNRRKR